MSPRRQVLLVAASTVAVGVFLVTVPTFRHFFDLGVYRGAVRYWLLDGGDLYDFRYQHTEYGFTYPPFAALVFSPLAALPWPVAIAASTIVNAAAVALLLRWYLLPVLRRHKWPIWTPCALGFLAVVVFEPARDTFSFGQVNLVLLALVCLDLQALSRDLRWAGVSIGLATAIKLTPAVFIGYLLVTRRYRAAAVAVGTTGVVSALAVLVAPDASRTYWTEALWDTDRVGNLAYVSNQSLRGVVARLDGAPIWWLAAVVVVLAAWFVLVRRADMVTGFALTGVLGCLISPVTWVHHLVWLLPAMFLLLGDAWDWRYRRRLVALGAVYVVLSSSVVWFWWAGADGWAAVVGSNTYVWISVGLLVALGHPLTGLANGSSFLAMQTSYLVTPAGRLAYDDTGGTGPLVVCLPGMGDNRSAYRHLRPLLVAAGHRVVTLDLRGHGETDVAWPDYSPQAIGADLLALLRHLDAGPAILITNSYTGATAVWAAAEAPTAFAALVLTDPFARVMPAPNPMIRLAMAAVGRVRPLWMVYWASLFKTRKPKDFAAARSVLSRQLARPGRMAAVRAMFAADVSVAEARTSSVRTPALVVMGSKDPDFPDPAAEAALMAERLHGSVAMIPDAGHYPQAEYPQETAAAILAFLSSPVIHRPL